MQGTAWRQEQWWNSFDGKGYAFSVNVRFREELPADSAAALPVLSVWDEFELARTASHPVVFTVDGTAYAVESADGGDFYPANQWVKLGVSWDPEQERLLVSRNGRQLAVRKLDAPPASAESKTQFDVFCDRLYPYAVDAGTVKSISEASQF